ncbi:uncharacterized protein EV154DRAFT_563229 [Mucor mucedo]|uniref:uncharacterized protein n=1 Tax=Mucor mucedo TaxID=29922 RepID=UPI00222064CF|nr:uncharacterized protein EV154DRAFT_563229 [Mucor mucedo]KAI7891516.1 hypothetical protein EV154DRAFT_563229 [Mucor mucedo]
MSTMAGLILLGMVLIIYMIMKQRSRYYGEIQDEEDGINCLRKTPTYYQWNRTPPSCHKNPEKESWEQRRSVLLKKYSAITTTTTASSS